MAVFNGTVFSSAVFDTGSGQTITCTGIASAEAFGLTLVPIIPAGIGSAEAFGSPRVFFFVIYPAGIASAETFGTTKLQVTIYVVGIDSAEGFGEGAFVGQPGNKTVTVVGIVSAEAFGWLVSSAGPAGYGVVQRLLACGAALVTDPCPPGEC